MELFQRNGQAGAYAQRRYRLGLKTYRARARPIFALALGPFIAGGVVGLFAERHLVAWVAGGAFGFGVTAILAWRDEPPAYVEKWREGAEGERKTARALRSLDDRKWIVAHDVESGCGNYDHVVLGRAGVFLLDSKNPTGKLTIENGRPYLRRRLDPESHESASWMMRATLRGAATLNEDLKRSLGRSPWVHAVAVLWCEFDEGVAETENCAFVHGSRLADWLGSRGDELDQDTVGELSAALEALVREGASGQR
jgi:hypothetical protein